MVVASGPAGPVLAGPVFTVILELRMRDNENTIVFDKMTVLV